ncbi:hypothetical protein HK405_014568, partial [Cladochytrium tenue]
SYLINEQDNNNTYVVDPEKTYRFRIINMASSTAFNFGVDGHDVTIIEIDGIDTNPLTVHSISVAPGQRYSLLLRTMNLGNVTCRDYAIRAITDPLTNNGDQNSPSVNAILRYNVANLTSNFHPFSAFLPSGQFFDTTLTPAVNGSAGAAASSGAFGPVAVSVVLNTASGRRSDGLFYRSFSANPYVAPLVPSLLTAISLTPSGMAAEQAVYGAGAVPVVVGNETSGSVVELVVLNDEPTGKAAVLHLHGHAFQVVMMDFGVGGASLRQTPVLRDTVVIGSGCSAVLRFQAANPGAWLFRSTNLWHFAAGLALTLVESPLLVSSILNDDGAGDDALLSSIINATCAALGQPWAGNAAGNSDSLVLDLSGAPTAPPPIPLVPAAAGWAALAACAVAALAGVASIAWLVLSLPPSQAADSAAARQVPIAETGRSGAASPPTRAATPAAGGMVDTIEEMAA